MSNPETDNICLIGREIYEELEQSGQLTDHQNNTIWIDTRSRLHSIGIGLIGARELKSKVAAHRSIDISEVDGSQFYSRNIGKLTRLPVRFILENKEAPH